MESRVSAVTFHYVIKAIVHHTGLDEQALMGQAGIDPALFARENATLPGEKLSALFQWAMQQSGDDDLALHLGASIPYQSLGLLGYLLINARTVGEMLEKFHHYQRLVGDRLRFHFSEEDAYYKIALQIQGNPLIPVPRFHAEVHLSAILNIIREISGQAVMPDRALFWHDAPERTEGYRVMFGPELRFGEGESAILLGKSALDIPLQFSNPSMLRYFETQAGRILEDFEDRTRYAQVRQVILRHLGDEEVTVGFVAEQLEVSARVLQKQLKTEGRTFTEALGSVRRQLAHHYLHQTRLDVTDIALFLGYSESSAFLRAYRGWYGTTPGADRRGPQHG